MGLISRWKAPTPKFWKKVINYSMTASAGAVALMSADSLGKLIMPDFSFKLHWITILVCKYVIVAGIVTAAMSKLTKETNDDKTP
jgi:NhaP-type Na+/H+ or K+/H+ antiporter